ncbi:MAG: hypothetical protein K0R34_3411 [Herbinix sp.]|jgi:hypothetical protein|nr:hypothetical protein [Herbinix sp.]
MSRNIKVKPGKGQSIVGFFVGIIFCFIGLFIVIPTIGPFGMIWTLMAIVITIINGYNAFTNKGIATHEITIGDEDSQSIHNYIESSKTSEQRLNELQSLYNKSMITDDEYQEKRKKILEEL